MQGLVACTGTGHSCIGTYRATARIAPETAKEVRHSAYQLKARTAHAHIRHCGQNTCAAELEMTSLRVPLHLSLIHISEPTRRTPI
eukprot:3214591-Pleurochrysis_carterae.AAC.1